jgi:2-keto-3-deoxy-6-phosphogluconate aldolase
MTERAKVDVEVVVVPVVAVAEIKAAAAVAGATILTGMALVEMAGHLPQHKDGCISRKVLDPRMRTQCSCWIT